MHEHRKRPCSACLTPTAKAWCPDCEPIAGDVHAIRRAARLLRTLGRGDVAAAVERALEDLRGQVDLLRQVARDKRHAKRRAWRQTTYGVLEQLCAVDGIGMRFCHVEEAFFADIDVRVRWNLLDEFARTTTGEEDPEELLRAARAYVVARLPDALRELEATCTCGHARPHLTKTGCAALGCGCGSSRRAKRARSTWSDEQILDAWPRLSE